jgi:hypothetical protein
MRIPSMVIVSLCFAVWTSCALAQSTLGELLDAGASKLSPEELRSTSSGRF